MRLITRVVRARHFRQRGARAGVAREFEPPSSARVRTSPINRLPGQSRGDSLQLSRRASHRRSARRATRSSRSRASRRRSARAARDGHRRPGSRAHRGVRPGDRSVRVRRRGIAPRRTRPHDSLPRQVPAQQPHRERRTFGANESNYRLQQQTVALAGVGDIRLAARRAQAPRNLQRGADAGERTSSSDAGAVRGRHRRQARRHPGAGRRRAGRTTI